MWHVHGVLFFFLGKMVMFDKRMSKSDYTGKLIFLGFPSTLCSSISLFAEVYLDNLNSVAADRAKPTPTCLGKNAMLLLLLLLIVLIVQLLWFPKPLLFVAYKI